MRVLSYPLCLPLLPLRPSTFYLGQKELQKGREGTKQV